MKHKIIIFSIIISVIFIFMISDDLFTINDEKNIEFYRGNNAFSAQEYNLAQKYFEQALKINPNHSEAVYMAAQSYMKGQYQSFNKSIKYYKQYLAHFSDKPPVTLKLIQHLKDVGMQDELKTLYLKSNNEFFKAKIWEYFDTDKALEHLISVPEESKNLEFYLMAARIYSSQHDYQQVIINANKAIKLSGLHKNNFYLLSQAYRNLKNFSKSKEALKIYETMNLLEKEKDPEQQLSYLNDLKSFNKNLKNSHEFNLLYTTLLIKNNRLTKAKENLLTVNLKKDSSQNRLLMLDTIHNLKAYELAILMYTETNKDTISLDEYLLYCQIHINISQQSELSNTCNEAYKKYPHSAPILYWHGVSLLMENEKSEALKHISNAIDHAPWVDSWIIHAAELFLIDGNVEAAKKTLNMSDRNSRALKQFRLNNSLF